MSSISPVHTSVMQMPEADVKSADGNNPAELQPNEYVESALASHNSFKSSMDNKETVSIPEKIQPLAEATPNPLVKVDLTVLDRPITFTRGVEKFTLVEGRDGKVQEFKM